MVETKSIVNLFREELPSIAFFNVKLILFCNTLIRSFQTKFNKMVEELETRFDKWLYVIRNINRLDTVPDKLRERIFEKLFETAEIARFTPDQIRSYEDSLKYYRDLKNSLDTAREEGLLEGIERKAGNSK